MKIRINYKKILTLSAISLCLTGCKDKKEQKKEIKSQNEIVTEQTTEITSEYTTEILNITDEEQKSADELFFEYCNDIKQELKDYVNSEDFEKAKIKGKEYFITGVDFVFFDQPIKGVYFDDLSDEFKSLALENINVTKEYIEELDPEFVANLSKKYQACTLYLSEKYLYVIDSIKNYLGEEKYNDLINKKEEITNKISEKTDELGDSLKKKYEDWKNK